MGWFSSRGICNDCGYVGAMYSSGCPICDSKNLEGTYRGDDYSFFIILAILVVICIFIV